MKSTQLARSEGVSDVLSFIKSPPQRREEMVVVGRAVIDGMVNQVGVLK